MRPYVLNTSLCVVLVAVLVLGLAIGTAVARHDQSSPDARVVAELDKEYQAAVKKNDAATMGRILADDFVLVTGSGKIVQKPDLLAEAHSARVQYEVQDDTDQTVRLWGDTAVITAKLHEKGTDGGKAFDYVLWFSDTYVRTPAGWRYVFGQSSLPLPQGAK
jgi:ketosteroid isomerase-like protein